MKKTVIKILTIISLLFIVGSILLNAFVMTSSAGIMAKIAAAFAGCALLNGIMYFAEGAKKSVASYFHDYVISYAISELVSVAAILTALDKGYLPAIMTTVLCYGALGVLAVAKDLGKINSYILSGSVTVIKLIWLICVLVLFQENIASVASAASSFALSYALLVMVFAKYADKEERGRPV